MLKVFHDKTHDRLIVRLHGSRHRSVAKAQVRRITAIGHLVKDPGQGPDTWTLYPVTRTLRGPRAERYARYRNACDWNGIRY